MDYTASMRGKMIAFAILQILLIQALPVESGESCQYGYSYSQIFPTKRYCDRGCCGTKYSGYSEVCCVVVYSSVANVGVIVGSVVGGLVGLGVFIGIIVCCACARSRQRPGAVIQPMNTNSQAIVMNSTSVAQGMSTSPGPPYGHDGYPNGVAQAGSVPFTNVPLEHLPPYPSKY